MKKMSRVFYLFLFLLLSCGKKETLLVTGDHTTWPRLTTRELNYFVPGHEDHYRISYINPEGIQVEIITDTDGRKLYNYPAGTVIVKEIYSGLEYTEGSKPINYTIMVKDPKHPDQQGGWVWLAKNPETGAETVFKSDMCIQCHEAANTRNPYGDKNPSGDFRDYAFYAP